MSAWVAGSFMLGSAALQVGGGMVSANATAKSQSAANRTNQNIADQANQAAMDNWLLSRGVNPGISSMPDLTSLAKDHPELQKEYNRVRTLGDKRSFGEWLQGYLSENPGSYIAKDYEAAGGNAVNTVLPLWAQIGGDPAEKALFDKIIQTGGIANQIDPDDPRSFASPSQISAYFQANPEAMANIKAELERTGDTRTAQQWMADHVKETGTDGWGRNLRDFAVTQNTRNAEENAAARAIPGEYQNILDRSRGSIEKIYNGGFLDSEMQALQPGLDARTRMADLQFDRNDEQRALLDQVLSTQMGGMDEVTAARLLGLDGILSTRKEGAQNIYDANLINADTYAQSAREAVERVLAQQGAINARRGYTGGSSMDDLTRARTLAPALQQGAGARAGAGIDFQKLLAAAMEQDSTGRAGAGESDALYRLDARTGNANRRSEILDADASMAQQQAALENAMARLGVISNDNTRQLSSIGLAPSLYQSQIGMGDLTSSQRFRDLDDTISRLNLLRTGGAVPTPNPVMPQVGSVISSGQIAGQAMSNLGTMAGSLFSNYKAPAAANTTNAATAQSNSYTPFLTGTGQSAKFDWLER